MKSVELVFKLTCIRPALATHSLDLTRLQAVERFKDSRYQWAQIIDIVARRSHDHNADTESGEILLVFNALVNGQQRVEVAFSRSQQRAVLDARPPGFLHCAYVVTWQLSPESLGYAFIE